MHPSSVRIRYSAIEFAMFYCDRGSGATLVLIHGIWGDHLDWEPVLDPLSQSCRVIAIDLPGFGKSPSESPDVSPASFVDQLIQTLDKFGIEKVSIAGNSFGGQIALSLALQNPERIEKLILVATGGLHAYPREQIEGALALRSEEFLDSLTPELNAALCSRLFCVQGSAAQKRYTEKQNANLLRSDFRSYVRFMRRCMRLALELDLLDRVDQLHLPVLLIQGDRDGLVRPEWIREALPRFVDARLSLFSTCGHVPQLEQPDKFSREVKSFLCS